MGKVPGLPHFFFRSVALWIMHRSGRVAKIGKAWSVLPHKLCQANRGGSTLINVQDDLWSTPLMVRTREVWML